MVVGLSFPQWDRFDRNHRSTENMSPQTKLIARRKKKKNFLSISKLFFAEFGRNTKWGGLRGGNMSPQTKLIKRKGENEKGKSQARTKIIPANFVVRLSTI